MALPPQQINEIDESTSQKIQSVLRQMYEMPKVITNEELRDRIDEYFSICKRENIKPGIGQLAMCLGYSRMTFYNWCRGVKCDHERKEICERARDYIESYLESAFMSGAINPVSGIFLMKNWFGYADKVEVETISNKSEYLEVKSPDEIRKQLEQDLPIDSEYKEL